MSSSAVTLRTSTPATASTCSAHSTGHSNRSARAIASLARESTVVAVLGDLDAASLRLLAEIHPRGSATTAIALLLDTASWGFGPGGPPTDPDGPCVRAARTLALARSLLGD